MPINSANSLPATTSTVTSSPVIPSRAITLPDDIIRTIFDHLLRIESPAEAITSVSRFSMVSKNIHSIAENYHLLHLRYRTAIVENFNILRVRTLATSDLRTMANSTLEVKTDFIPKIEMSGEKKSDFVEAFKENRLEEKDIKTVQHFAQRVYMDDLFNNPDSPWESGRVNTLPETAQKKEFCAIMNHKINELKMSQSNINSLARLAEGNNQIPGQPATEATKLLVSWLNQDLVHPGVYDIQNLMSNTSDVEAALSSSMQRIWSNTTGDILPCRNFVAFYNSRHFRPLVINANILYFQTRSRPYSSEENDLIGQALSSGKHNLANAIFTADYSSLKGQVYNHFQDRRFIDNSTESVALYSFLAMLQETNKLNTYTYIQKVGERSWQAETDTDFGKYSDLQNSKHKLIAESAQAAYVFNKRFSRLKAIQHLRKETQNVTKTLLQNYTCDLIGLADLMVNGPVLFRDHVAKLFAVNKTIPRFFENPMRMTQQHADDLILRKLVPYISFHASENDIRRLEKIGFSNPQVDQAMRSRKAYHLVTAKDEEHVSSQRISAIQKLLLPMISENTEEMRSIMHPITLFMMLEKTGLEPEERQNAIQFCVSMIEEKRFDAAMFHSSSFLDTSIPEIKKAIDHRLKHIQKNLSEGQYDEILFDRLLNPQESLSHDHETLLDLTLKSFVSKENQSQQRDHLQITKLTKAVEERLVMLIQQHEFTAKKTLKSKISNKGASDYKVEPSDEDLNLLSLALNSHSYSSKTIQKASAEKVKEIASALHLTDQEQMVLKNLRVRFKK